MRQYKIHKISIMKDGRYQLGLSIPIEFSTWLNTLVTISQSGGCLLLTSGPVPIAFDIKQLKKQGEIVEKIKI
jgi:hypothetical protein